MRDNCRRLLKVVDHQVPPLFSTIIRSSSATRSVRLSNLPDLVGINTASTTLTENGPPQPECGASVRAFADRILAVYSPSLASCARSRRQARRETLEQFP